MLENRNSYLLVQIKEVSFQTLSSDKKILTEFQRIYNTFSKSEIRVTSRKTNSGTLYRSDLKIFYPGLSDNDFLQFYELLQKRFILRITLTNNDVFQLGSLSIPMKLSTIYSLKGTQLSFKNESIGPIKTTSEGNLEIGFPYVLKTEL